MKKTLLVLLAAVMLMPMLATASSGAHLYEAPIDINDKESLRRGAQHLVTIVTVVMPLLSCVSIVLRKIWKCLRKMCVAC